MISVSAITKTYPGVVALDDVTVAFNAGEVVAISGANGAGKSTLARIIAGIEQATSGEVRVNGEEDHVVRSVRDAHRAGVMLLHQEPLVIDTFGILENLQVYDLSGTVPASVKRSGERRSRVEAALERTGLDQLPRDTLGAALTPGLRQTLALARAMVYDHRVLILDETTASASESYFELTREFVREDVADGKCVIFVSHRLQEVFDIADRIVVLRNGRLVESKSVPETDRNEIEELIIGSAVKALSSPPPIRNDAPTKIEVRHLSARKVKDISFAAKAGEIVGVYGLVGSGRTTLAKALAGAGRIEDGELELNGQPLSLENLRQGIHAGIVYLSEDRRRDGFVPHFSNSENISLANLRAVSRNTVLNRKAEASLASQLISRLDIKGRPRGYTSELSGGNQQKVAIARWVATEPEVFVFDEPTKGIDVGARAKIYEILFGLAREGKTLIVVSSEAEEVLLLSHKILVLRDGYLVHTADPRTATAEDIVRPALADTSEGALVQ